MAYQNQDQQQWQTTPGPPPPTPKKHRTLKIFGGLAGGIIALSIVSAIANGGDKPTPGTAEPAATTAGKPAAKVAAKAKPVKVAPGIGATVRDGKFSFKVTKLAKRSEIGTAPAGVTAQGMFTLIYITVENIGSKPQTLDGSSQELYDQQGRKFAADTEAAVYLPDSHSFLEAINPGNSVKGILVYDLPPTAVPTKLEVHDSMFSGGADIALK